MANTDQAEATTTMPQMAARPVPADLDKIIHWRTAADVGMLQSLVSKPPFRSVVLRFSPEAAEHVLKITNNNNRPLTPKNVDIIRQSLKRDSFDLTGDTLKFSRSGMLLDGQHRLQACVKEKTDLTTHVVFGLDDAIFDVLDQGRKRKPGDILHIAGIDDSNMMASSVRWATALEAAETPQHLKLDSREVVRLASGPYKGLGKWATQGRMLNQAYRHSPSMLTGLLYTIAEQGSVALAEKFAHEWIYGAKIGVNKNFDMLQRRVIEMTNHAGGRLNPYVRAALIVQTFNAWNAGIELAPRDIDWRNNWPFPAVQVDPAKYRVQAEHQNVFQGLSTNQQMVFVALESKQDRNGAGRSTISVDELATLTDIKLSTVTTIMRQLENRGLIQTIKGAETSADKGVYFLRKDAEAETAQA